MNVENVVDRAHFSVLFLQKATGRGERPSSGCGLQAGASVYSRYASLYRSKKGLVKDIFPYFENKEYLLFIPPQSSVPPPARPAGPRTSSD